MKLGFTGRSLNPREQSIIRKNWGGPFRGGGSITLPALPREVPTTGRSAEACIPLWFAWKRRIRYQPVATSDRISVGDEQKTGALRMSLQVKTNLHPWLFYSERETAGTYFADAEKVDPLLGGVPRCGLARELKICHWHILSVPGPAFSVRRG